MGYFHALENLKLIIFFLKLLMAVLVFNIAARLLLMIFIEINVVKTSIRGISE